MKIERTRNTVRNMSWGYIYKMISLILPFIFRTVMIRVLGAEYLGVNSLFISVLQVLSLSELGFGSAMVFSMYKPIAENDEDTICALLEYYKKIYTIIGLVVMTLGLVLTPVIPFLISGDYPDQINIYFVYIMFLINTSISYFLFAYRGSLLSAFQRNDIESKILIIVTVFRYSSEIACIVAFKQYYVFLLLEIVSTVLINILKYIYTNKMYPQYKPNGSITIEEKKKIKSNVYALMCHKVGGIVLNSADNIVLSAFMGVVLVANYNNYYYLINAVTGIVVICFSGMTAGIGNSFVTETIEKNREYFRKVLFFNAWVVGWCSVCFVCLYQDFMELWVGKKYMFNDLVMVLFVLYFFVHCIRRTIISFRDGAGMWRDNKWQPIVSAVCNLIINIVLVQFIGVYGILLSSILCMIVIDIPWEAGAFCSKICLPRKNYIIDLLKYFSVTVIVCALMYVGTRNIHFIPGINLLIKGGACIIVPNFIFWFVFHKTNEYKYFRELIKKFLKKIKLKKTLSINRE